ncbi:MAG TPA: type II secretion system protein [Tepidisphaeraceae bacterium]|nr:type II secretion system protein [Tepidisphaeraceae bacterium]
MRRRGWIMLELLASIVLIGVLLGATAVAITGQRRVAARTADLRRAIESAERAAVALHRGEPIPEIPGVIIQVESLEADGGAWRRITATIGGRSASLHMLAETNP